MKGWLIKDDIKYGFGDEHGTGEIFAIAKKW